jgi:hypothetical protein
MPRRPASITQADIARALRAAKAVGCSCVEVTPEGAILFRFDNPDQSAVRLLKREIIL